MVFGLWVADASFAQDIKLADAFLHGIYAPYKATGTPIDLTGPDAEKIFEPTLASLLRQDEAALDGDVGVLDSDPICSCQDFDIRAVKLSIKPDGDGRAKATATFKNLDTTTTVNFDLVTFNDAWRIVDIHSKDLPSLRKALEDEIATSKPKPH